MKVIIPTEVHSAHAQQHKIIGKVCFGKKKVTEKLHYGPRPYTYVFLTPFLKIDFVSKYDYAF